MENLNLITCLIAIFFTALLILKVINEKQLKEYLLKYGEELEAEAKQINTPFICRIDLSYQINGQTVVKKNFYISQFDWYPRTETSKRFPVLVDPSNPNRFLFNIRKFHFKKVSNDSAQNFLERHKVEQPDIEG